MTQTEKKKMIRTMSKRKRQKPPWERMFDELSKFRKKYKHCDVPTKWSENVKLGRWVSHQRNMAGKGLLSDDRYNRLKQLGFVFHMHNISWEKHYKRLIDFRNDQGHCNVPEQWTNYGGLGGWVHSQRTRWKRGKLETERIERLEKAGFVWERHNEAWEQKFEKLIQFKNKEGHCDVPPGWTEFPKLAEWTYQQRKHKKNGKMPPERIKRMEDLGFKWTLKKF